MTKAPLPYRTLSFTERFSMKDDDDYLLDPLYE